MQKTLKPIADSTTLAHEVIAAIREKKGFDIALLDLRGLRNAVCDYFIFCSGNSDTQVKALADNVEHEVRNKLREKPWQSEGNRTGEWVLLDYINVVVHVMLPRIRDYYGIEELWGDAEITRWAE
ncbi:MAG: ribosome silencing factor [Bacteroidetes bacterium]|nr:ribosome silencing factor [Bacteroidota bacterium]